MHNSLSQTSENKNKKQNLLLALSKFCTHEKLHSFSGKVLSTSRIFNKFNFKLSEVPNLWCQTSLSLYSHTEIDKILMLLDEVRIFEGQNILLKRFCGNTVITLRIGDLTSFKSLNAQSPPNPQILSAASQHKK